MCPCVCVCLFLSVSGRESVRVRVCRRFLTSHCALQVACAGNPLAVHPWLASSLERVHLSHRKDGLSHSDPNKCHARGFTRAAKVAYGWSGDKTTLALAAAWAKDSRVETIDVHPEVCSNVVPSSLPCPKGTLNRWRPLGTRRFATTCTRNCARPRLCYHARNASTMQK